VTHPVDVTATGAALCVVAVMPLSLSMASAEVVPAAKVVSVQ
jgi:hypothetical protein